MKKIKSLISFVLMAAMMLTLIPAMGLNVMAAETITNLYFADNIVLDFDAAKTEYTVVVPWSKADGFVLPELKWEPKTADVTVTGSLDTGALTVADGTNTYTINLSKVGETMYANGDAEAGLWTPVWCGFELVTENPGQGLNSIYTKGAGYYTPDKTPETLEANVTYLAQSMVRKNTSHTGDLTASESVKSPGSSGATANFDGSFYKWNADGSARDGSFAVTTSEWLTHYRTIIANSSVQVVDYYMNHTNWNPAHLVVDDYFLGELVVSDVKVTDANGLRAIDMGIPAESETITLSAVKLNQLGNQAGLGSGNSAAAWSVLGNPEGITVADGVVTIAPTVAAGTYAIEAEVATGIDGGKQTKAKGVYTINIFNPNDLVALVNDVSFTNVVVSDFSFDKFAYNVPVPVVYTNDVDTYVYDIPKLVDFTLADSNDAVVVTEAEEIPGATTIKVTHDGVEKTYTFNFYLAGKNMYANGSVEAGMWTPVWCGFELVTENTGKGKNSIYTKSGYYTPDSTPETVTAGVTYLAQSMVRKYDGYTSDLSASESVKVPGAGVVSNFDGTFYKWNADGSERTGGIPLTADNWLTHYRTIIPNSTSQVVDYYMNNASWNAAHMVVDEYFLGELVANTIIKDSENATSKEMFIPAADVTINLSAERVNQLGNKAGLGTAAPVFTWDVKGPSEDVTVDNGVVNVKANAAAGTYYVEATAPTGIANSKQTYTKNVYKIKVTDPAMFAGTLTALKVSNTDIDFAWDTYEYDVKVPVLHKNEKDSYVMPKVTATGYKDANVEITYPEAIPGDITVEVEDGKTYTISLDFVGTNMYLNPGLEIMGNNTGTPADWSVQTGLELANDGDIYANIYQVTNKNAVVSPASKPTLEVGKMYIHQNLVRKADEAKIELHQNENQRDYVKMRLDGKNADGIYTYYNADGTTNNNDFVTLTEEWHPHIATMYEPTTANTKFCNIYVDWSYCYRYAIDDFWLSELTIADIEFDADKEVLATSSAAQTVNLTAKAVNSIGNLAGIKDNHTLTFRLGNDAPEGANITEDGEITVPANFNGTFEVEAVATPTWQGAAQKNFVKAYKIVVGDAAIWYEATDDGVVANLMYTGNETGYKFINAIYNVLANGELEFVTAYTKDVDSALTYAEPITLTAGQVAKTFFWKWEDITPLTKSFTFTK